MHWIDWLIMTLPLAICGFIAIYTRRYVKSVADFMAGGRNAGRFLICAARSEQGSGAAVFVSNFQTFVVSGFALGWWMQLTVPVGLLLMVTGWVIYRYRETRVMTLGQFFELRYSRNFRLFAGMLGFFAGLVNFGIIPAVGARFMVAFLYLPQSLYLHIGTFGIDIPTFLPLMALFLTICVVMTTTAGQVSVLLTDCAEGVFSQIFYTFIAVVLLVSVFKWADTRAVLLSAAPRESMVNPFDTSKIHDFNIWLVLMGIFSSVYRTMSWQNSHAFNSSAATPHESRMGGILGRWRGLAATVMVTLLSVCALTYMKMHPEQIDAALRPIKDPATRDQMRSPLALTMMLPVGVKGSLLAICVMGIIAGDGIHLHSWGSIFIQDVVLPLRQRRTKNQLSIIFVVFGFLWDIVGILAFQCLIIPWLLTVIYPDSNVHFLPPPGRATQTIVLLLGCLIWGLLGLLLFKLLVRKVFCEGPLTPSEHLNLLRWSIVGVAVWAFFFGALFPQTRYVGFWFAITEAIFVGGAGIAIIGGLYWARGTVGGAWIGLLVGSGLALLGIGMQVYYENVLGVEFFLNGPQIGFFSSIAAIISYGITSLLSHRAPHNMDKLLHRGIYSIEEDVEVSSPGPKRSWVYRILTFGIDDKFSRSDRWITIGITLWSMLWFIVFAVGSLLYLFHRWSDAAWAGYWLWTAVYFPVVIGAFTTVWFTWGCTHDMIDFFRRLGEETVDLHDDGSVTPDLIEINVLDSSIGLPAPNFLAAGPPDAIEMSMAQSTGDITPNR